MKPGLELEGRAGAGGAGAGGAGGGGAAVRGVLLAEAGVLAAVGCICASAIEAIIA